MATPGVSASEDRTHGRHDNVLQACRNLNCSDHFRRLNFQEREEIQTAPPAVASCVATAPASHRAKPLGDGDSR
jgi:hypothetical protein